MLKNFQQTTLGQICEFTNGGAWSQDEYADEGVRVVRVTDIKNGTVDFSSCKFLPLEAVKKYSRHLLKYNDLVICTVGSHPTQPGSVVGRTAIIPQYAQGSLLNQNAVLLRAATPQLDQKWLGYFGKSKAFHDYIISCARGSANQVRMAIGLLKEMNVILPPVANQQKIAAILSSYDDLIENNTRRIAILEEMARLIYREWFVYFRFPGHEKAKFVDSPLGKIPQGWETTTLPDIVEILSGGTPKTTEPSYWDGNIPFFTPRDAPSSFYVITTEKNITKEGLQKCNSKLYPESTVFITARGSVGKLALAAVPMTMNQSCYALQGKAGIGQMYTYLLAEQSVNKLKKSSHGAVFDTIIIDTFKLIQVVLPRKELLVEFENIVAPVFSLIKNLINSTDNLRQTRDLLLPRLISGEIDVSELDIPISTN